MKKKLDNKKVQDAFHACMEKIRELKPEEQTKVIMMLLIFCDTGDG